MKNIILTIDGYLASSRKKEDKIQSIIYQIAKSKNIEMKKGYNFENVSSVGLGAVLRTLLTITKLVNNVDEEFSNLNIIIFGKSMGGAKAHSLFKKKWSYFEKFNKIALVTIDAHGQILLDGNLRPFGKSKSLKFNKKWSKDTEKFRAYNIYQWKEWPYGANFPEAFKNINISDEEEIDHFNIVNLDKVKNIIIEAFDFIK